METTSGRTGPLLVLAFTGACNAVYSVDDLTARPTDEPGASTTTYVGGAGGTSSNAGKGGGAGGTSTSSAGGGTSSAGGGSGGTSSGPCSVTSETHVAGVVDQAVDAAKSVWQGDVPSNLASLDADAAFVHVDASAGVEFSSLLKLTGFGFTPPKGGEVVGVEAAVVRDCKTSHTIADARVQLLAGNDLTGENRARENVLWPYFDGTGSPVSPYEEARYGGPSDGWGRSWTTAEVADSGFGLALRAHNTSAGNKSLDAWANVTKVALTVHYEVCP